MKLTEICKTLEENTDKGTIHSFIQFYEQLFTPIQDTVKNVLEIGIFDGGSIKLWEHFFPNAQIYGMDVHYKAKYDYEPKTTIIIDNAYVPNAQLDNVMFDIMIDDGPHSLSSQLTFIDLYYDKLADNGYMIIEDIQSEDDLKTILSYAQSKGIYCYGVDLRHIKGRYDDLLVVIQKHRI